MQSKTIGEKLREGSRAAVFPVVACAASLALGAVIIAAMGFDWRLACVNLIEGSLGSKKNIGETLIKAVPLLFTGLSFAVAKQCGLINLGGEGQVYLGGLFATVAGVYFSGFPAIIHLPLVILAGALGGGLWGMLAGWLKNRFGASEMITGIMLNYIAIQLISYFSTGPMKDAASDNAQSSLIADSAILPRIWQGTRLHAGVLLAALCVVFYYIFMWRTTKGYEMRLVGLNPKAARYCGIKVARSALLAMFLAGCFGGLAGTSEILGIQYRLFPGFSPNYGFDGIAVALLGNNKPLGIVLASLLFGILRSGSNKMQMSAGVPSAVIQIVQAFVILFVVGRDLFDVFKNKPRAKLSAARKGGA